jgi:purine-binding chemotaxis protein CheW
VNSSHQHVGFTLDEHRYALPLSVVERIVRVVEVTPLPKAPEIVLGIVNVQGQVLPVVNVRKRFRLPERPVDLSDQLIIAHSAKRAFALMVDAADIIECSDQEVFPADRILPVMEYFDGVAKLEDGLVLIHDLDKFLSLEEEEALDGALK